MHATDGYGVPPISHPLFPLECPTAKRKVHTGGSRVYRCVPRRPSARKVSSDHPLAQPPFILRSVSAAPSPFPCPAYLRLPSAPSLPVRCHPSQPIAILLHSALVPGPGAATAGTQQSRSATRNHPAFSLPAIPFVPARQERSSHTGGPDRQSRLSTVPLALRNCFGSESGMFWKRERPSGAAALSSSRALYPQVSSPGRVCSHERACATVRLFFLFFSLCVCLSFLLPLHPAPQRRYETQSYKESLSRLRQLPHVYPSLNLVLRPPHPHSPTCSPPNTSHPRPSLPLPLSTHKPTHTRATHTNTGAHKPTRRLSCRPRRHVRRAGGRTDPWGGGARAPRRTGGGRLGADRCAAGGACGA